MTASTGAGSSAGSRAGAASGDDGMAATARRDFFGFLGFFSDDGAASSVSESDPAESREALLARTAFRTGTALGSGSRTDSAAAAGAPSATSFSSGLDEGTASSSISAILAASMSCCSDDVEAAGADSSGFAGAGSLEDAAGEDDVAGVSFAGVALAVAAGAAAAGATAVSGGSPSAWSTSPSAFLSPACACVTRSPASPATLISRSDVVKLEKEENIRAPLRLLAAHSRGSIRRVRRAAGDASSREGGGRRSTRSANPDSSSEVSRRRRGGRRGGAVTAPTRTSCGTGSRDGSRSQTCQRRVRPIQEGTAAREGRSRRGGAFLKSDVPTRATSSLR
jgi:hypothetical protein